MSQFRREERGRKSPSSRTGSLSYVCCLWKYAQDETNGSRLEVMTYGIKIGHSCPLCYSGLIYRALCRAGNQSKTKKNIKKNYDQQMRNINKIWDTKKNVIHCRSF